MSFEHVSNWNGKVFQKQEQDHRIQFAGHTQHFAEAPVGSGSDFRIPRPTSGRENGLHPRASETPDLPDAGARRSKRQRLCLPAAKVHLRIA